MSSGTMPEFETTAPGTAIPKIIHQTLTSSDLPQVFADSITRIKKTNPGWKHVFYDGEGRERFIRENYGPEILEYYDRIDPRYAAARADLFRYLLMYRVGGVYFDIKSTTVRPLDQMLRPDDRYILSHWRNQPGEAHAGWGLHDGVRETGHGEYQQWHVICAPGHPFLKAVIERVLRNIDDYSPWRFGLGQLAVLQVTGPIAYTMAIQPIRHLHPHRLVKNEDEIGLEYSVLPDIAHSKLFPVHYLNVEQPMIATRGLGWCGAQLYLAARWVRNKGREWLGARPLTSG